MGLEFGEPVGGTSHEFSMMLDLGRGAVCFPVLLDGADAVGTDGDDPLDFVLRQVLEVLFGQRLEYEIVAEASDGVAGAFLFFEHAEAGAEIIHHLRKRGDDLAAFGVVAAHAA